MKADSSLKPPSWNGMDWICLVALLFFYSALSFRTFRWNITPIEDAAMLIRYSQNLADGYGLRWNPNLPPADGATDFLYAVAAGVIARVLHISAVAGTRILNLVAHFFTCALIYAAGRRIFRASRWYCIFAVCYLIAGPAWKMAEGCFGAPFFAAALLLTWCCGLQYALRSRSNTTAIAFGVSALLSGLIRPEGVLIGMILAGAVLYLCPPESRRRFVVLYATVMVLLGTPYFLWHWHYYGYPLPNPFYVKGSGHLYLGSVIDAAKHIAVFIAPFVPLIPLGYLRRSTVRITNALLGVMGAFTVMWILLNNWNNHYFRFQYPILPITLLACAGIVQGIGSEAVGRTLRLDSPRQRRALAAMYFFSLFVSMAYLDRQFNRSYDEAHGMRNFATSLQPYASEGYTMAVTEAGALPLYSQWRAIDLLGLNDATIAHGGTSAIHGYLAKVKPELIMVHIDGNGSASQLRVIMGLANGEGPLGYEKFSAASQFAYENHYVLAAMYGSSVCNLHAYWVKPDFARSEELVNVIRSQPYYFLDNGILSHDYRNELTPDMRCRM